MLKLSNQNVESELKAYCQKWLCYLSLNSFEQALSLVTVPNNYGARWGEKEIKEAVFDYYGSESEFKIANTDIAFCTPEFMQCNDGNYLFGFYFPVNGEVTDLTVEFEFSRVKNNEFSATINDIHVL